MDLLKWPDRLPCPFYEYNYAPQGSFVRTQMDSGLARHRRKSRQQRMRINVVWKIPREDMSVFRIFVMDLVGGNGWVWFEMKLMFEDELETINARFINPEQPYNAQNVLNKIWSVTAELEVIRQPQVSKNWSLMSDYLLVRPNIFDLAVNREWPEK